MGDESLPLMPDSFEAEWNDNRFYYREVCDVPAGVDTQKVASQTEYSLMTLIEQTDVPDDVDLKTEIRRRPSVGKVVAEITMTPGKPESMEYAGMAMICSEMMSQILGNDQETFEDIVKAAIMTSGEGDMKSLVMKEMFPDTTLPDKE
mgnify:FL=1